MRQPTALRLIVVLLALGLGLAPALAHDEPAPIKFGSTDRDFTQRHLTIFVRPDFATGVVGGRVHVRFAALVDGMRTLRLHCKDTKVHVVKDVDGGFLNWKHEKDLLSVTLPRALSKDEESEVRVEYTAAPRAGLLFHRPTKAAPNAPTWVYSQGQASENRRWIPCYDEPDDRCSWDLYAEVPEAMQTVSNGVLLDQQPGAAGLRIDHWHFSDRSPTYLISLVAGEMLQLTEKWGDVDLEYNAPKGKATEAMLRRAVANTPAMMDFFSEYTGTKYPWPRYAQTLVWDFLWGGMENVTATTLNMRVLHTDADRPAYRSDALVAHELAHMWFGDLITCKTWPHLWLNEGFATYFTDLFFEKHYGPEEFDARRREQNERYMDRVPKPHELDVKRTERGDVPIELNGWKAYNRGAAILHMLRRELGNETFKKGIAAYVRKHADQAVVSEQLRNVMEATAGRDLKWFWDQWVYGAGYPILEIEHEYGPDGKPVALVVRQVQEQKGAQGLFRMTLWMQIREFTAAKALTIYEREHRFVWSELTKVEESSEGGDRPQTPEPVLPYLAISTSADVLARVRLKQSYEAWTAMLMHSSSPSICLEAVRGLEQFGDAGVANLGKGLEKGIWWTVCRECARVLGRIGSDAAAQQLVRGVAHEDARVRAEVATALGDTSATHAAEALLGMVAKDPSAYVRSAAARSIGRLHLPEASKILAGLLEVESHRDIVRRGALDGLAALGDPMGIQLAMRYLPYSVSKGAMHQGRRAALDCMLKLGPDDPEVHAAVVGLLDDPYFRMRQWAATACGVYGIESARAKLENLRHHDWSSGVQGEAFRALEKLK